MRNDKFGKPGWRVVDLETAILAIGFALVSVLFPQYAFAQYPARPVKLIVGLAPGGAPDMASRIEEFFHQALQSLPGVTVKVNPDRFSYLLKDGKTWLPFRPEMFHPDHLIREMDRIADAPGIVGIGVSSNLDGVALDLPEEQKQQIFSGNATRLFGKRLAM